VPDTLPLRYAQTLLKLSRAPREELQADLQRLKLPLVLLQARDAQDIQISVEDYGRLFIHLVKKLQFDITGATDEASAALEFSTYQMLFLAMTHAKNLGQAMQRAAIYFRRFEASGDTFVLEQNDDLVICRFQFSVNGAQRELIDAQNFDMGSLNWLQGDTGRILSIALWHRTCSWFIGAPIELSAVSLAQPRQQSAAAHAKIFGVPVEFEAGCYSFQFHRRFLQFPIVQGEAAVADMLKNFPAAIMRLDNSPASINSRVLGLIGTDFSAELPTLQDVAERLHMTTPTLHRRLREEGTTFQQLKDQARRDAAIQLLRKGNISGAQLAELIGFSDASTFHRAFKKWTGKTTQEFRDNSCT
jgi:AraC-like DNA-binding protein